MNDRQPGLVPGMLGLNVSCGFWGLWPPQPKPKHLGKVETFLPDIAARPSRLAMCSRLPAITLFTIFQRSSPLYRPGRQFPPPNHQARPSQQNILPSQSRPKTCSQELHTNPACIWLQTSKHQDVDSLPNIRPTSHAC